MSSYISIRRKHITEEVNHIYAKMKSIGVKINGEDITIENVIDGCGYDNNLYIYDSYGVTYGVTNGNEEVNNDNEGVTDDNEGVTDDNQGVTNDNEGVTDDNEGVTDGNEGVTKNVKSNDVKSKTCERHIFDIKKGSIYKCEEISTNEAVIDENGSIGKVCKLCKVICDNKYLK